MIRPVFAQAAPKKRIATKRTLKIAFFSRLVMAVDPRPNLTHPMAAFNLIRVSRL